MAFSQFSIFPVPKKPVEKNEGTKKRDALALALTYAFQITDSRDLLSSRYLHELYDHRSEIISKTMDNFFGTPEEAAVSDAVAHLSDPNAEMAAFEIFLVGKALVQSHVIEKLHISDKLVDRATIVEKIMERLIAKKPEFDDHARQKLGLLGKSYQAEYNNKTQNDITHPVTAMASPAA